MTAADIVRSTTITAVWVGLGGDPPVHNRARAFYRNGDNPEAVLLNDAKGRWFDYRDNIGGGVLDLVQMVRGGTRQEALRWVAAFIGIDMEEKSLSPHKRRVFAWLKSDAEDLARECAWWMGAYSVALESAKAEALEKEDMVTLARAARELYWLQSSQPSAILSRYLKARKDSPDEVASLVEEGRKDEEDAVLITAAIVMMLEKRQEAGHA